MSKAATWLERARQLPLVAILRGLNPLQATGIGQALVHSGFRLLEVPLNRPGALQCIEALRADLPAEALVGGGTVLTVSDVNAVHAAGGQMVVSPNTDVRVISRAAELGMLCAPGVATPTEAFTALQAGAHALKVFPSDMVGHGGLKALRSVLPAQTELWPVGGISPGSMASAASSMCLVTTRRACGARPRPTARHGNSGWYHRDQGVGLSRDGYRHNDLPVAEAIAGTTPQQRVSRQRVRTWAAARACRTNPGIQKRPTVVPARCLGVRWKQPIRRRAGIWSLRVR
jgi:2-dehydro-3-deoxyphosphogalactonate aldolase